MICCSAVTLQDWFKKHEIDTGVRDDIPTAERERIKALGERTRNCAKPTRFCDWPARFRAGGARPPQEELKSFIDQRSERFGVESICTLLWVAPSVYWRHAARQRDLSLHSARAC
jgi:hypothetical protein